MSNPVVRFGKPNAMQSYKTFPFQQTFRLFILQKSFKTDNCL